MKSGGWMILDSAETLFTAAKARVFGPESGNQSNNASKKAKIEMDFEKCPKWQAMTEVITEIKEEISLNGNSDQKVLIFVSDERVKQQLEDLLDIGADNLLKRMFNKCLGERFGYIPGVDYGQKEHKDKGKGKKSSFQKPNNDENPLPSELIKEECPALTIIRSLQVGNFTINRLINQLRPRYVILYDCEIGVVRQLEVFQAMNPDFKIKVYFMMHGKSVEEQAYLSSLRQEKEAFDKLIREKTTMVIPEDREGRDDTNLDLIRGSDKASDQSIASNLNTRKGGADETKKSNPKVIVDMREFRSELPSLLHKRGIDIEPITLEVGDYIVTPEICVERKSISDLIGSLNGGRLFNQATSMTRFYTRPMLLIEFDQNKPFALQGKYYLSRDIASSDLVARLQLLTIHFPKLRILWSPSPHATTELFEELKRGREEPDAAKAAAISIDFIDDFNTDKFNPAVKDFLSKLPGITTKNIFGILNRVNSLAELMSLSQEDLEELLGNKQNAQDLFESLHDKLQPKEESEDVRRPVLGSKSRHPGAKSGGGSRFKTTKKK